MVMSTHGSQISGTTSGSKYSTTKGLQLHFRASHITYQCVPPLNKRANKTERAIQTFKRHFITILAGTHPSFPIHFWHELIPRAELTLNMMRSYADQPSISAYHGINRRPFDFASHPLAPCGTLVVIHNSICETWDNFGLVGFYLGPSLQNYRSYRCLIQETMAIRILDSIILFPAPLVAPGASRLDELLSLIDLQNTRYCRRQRTRPSVQDSAT